MYHTVAYNAAAAGVNAANTDMLAVPDTEVTARNNHFTFSEPYKLLGASLVGASVTRARFQVPHWNAYMESGIFNANRALTPPTNPQWDDWRFYAPTIPMEEEFQVQVSNNLGAGTEQENVILQLGTDDWKLPQDRFRGAEFAGIARATFTLTPTINVWSGGQALTFTQSLRGGVWLIMASAVQGANAVAYRWIFPRNKMYRGRRLRPGGLVQTAVGDFLPNNIDPWAFNWGEKGAFHTFELPTIEVLGATAGAITYNVFMWLAYLGSDRGILDQYVRGGT